MTETIKDWFDRQSPRAKHEAVRRYVALSEIRAFELIGFTRSAAVAVVSVRNGKSSSAIWAWLQLVAGVPHDLVLYHVCPRWGQ